MNKFSKATKPQNQESELTAAEKKAVADFGILKTELNAAFIKRTIEIDTLLLSFVMKQHCLFLGLTGTAKSLLTETFSLATQKDYSRCILHQFTTPEDLFGIIDVQKMVNDGEYVRVDGMGIQDKEVVFLDEVFKATTILQSLLTYLEERRYAQNGQLVDCPSEMVVGASNEYPADSSLDALYDRFLLRRWIPYLTSRQDRKLLVTMKMNPQDMVVHKLSADSIQTMRDMSKAVVIPDSVIEAYLDIIEDLEKEQIVVSDRRMRRVLQIVRTSAALSGRKIANSMDLMPIVDAIWDRHTDRPTVEHIVSKRSKPESVIKAEAFRAAADEKYDPMKVVIESVPKRDHAVITSLTTCSSGICDIIDEMEDALEDTLDNEDIQDILAPIYDMEHNITRWVERAMKADRKQRRGQR